MFASIVLGGSLVLWLIAICFTLAFSRMSWWDGSSTSDRVPSKLKLGAAERSNQRELCECAFFLNLVIGLNSLSAATF